MKNTSNIRIVGLGISANIGVLLILVGGLFLLKTTGFLSFEITKILISWPMLLVALGLIALMCRHFLNAVVLLVVGCYFLLPRIYRVQGLEFPMDFMMYRNLFWAVLFILAGLAVIFRDRCRTHFHKQWCRKAQADVRPNK
ncbi:MAG: DUF5668 domain-containing protein, partial [Bacteroidales bacterium]|nr:DUF5668 domain-containing protein [Bacteroidales bacterium]